MANIVPVTNFNLGRHVWEKQKDEPEKHYAYFLLWRDLGLIRSYKVVADEVNLTVEHVRDVAARWRWSERVAKWDAHLQAKADKAIEDAAATMAVRQAKLGMRLQDKAVAALDMLDLSEPTVKDVVQLAEVGAKIERQARGENVQDAPTVTIQLATVPEWARGSKFIVDTPKELPAVVVDEIESEQSEPVTEGEYVDSEA